MSRCVILLVVLLPWTVMAQVSPWDPEQLGDARFSRNYKDPLDTILRPRSETLSEAIWQVLSMSCSVSFPAWAHSYCVRQSC